MNLMVGDVLAHTYRVWPVPRPKSGIQLLFFWGGRGFVKGICSQEHFHGIAKFSLFFSSGLSQLQAFQVTGCIYAQCVEGGLTTFSKIQPKVLDD
jgi:hypothetical protein